MPGEFKHWSTVITRPVRRVAQAAVVTTLVAGAVGVSHYDKSVNLSVDGKTSSVHVFGSTVSDVLKKQDIAIGEHDVVAPSLDSKVEDGQKIVVRYGRKLTVTIDGKTREYWTTATTVAAALQELGIRADSAKLSASRSQPLGRQGLALSVTTPKNVSVRVDGKNLTQSTTGATVNDVLSELGVKVDKDDRVKPGLKTAVNDGLKVAVQRVTTKQVKATEEISFTTAEKSDSSLYKGESKTVKQGQAGAKVVTYRVTTVDGKTESKKAVSSVVTQQPVAKVVAVGTKSRPSTTSSGGGSITTGNKPSADGLNWGALAECESGGNPSTNTGNGFYGLYQFDLQTWQSVGGSGYPHQNSASEQTYRAQILYSQRGDSPWPVCGSRLYS
jgi:uncharacterized protein YabE (DUF348 family)